MICPVHHSGMAGRDIFRDVAALNAALTALPPDAFVVAFFIHALQVSQDEWMEPLARHLREAGFVTVGVTTPESAERCHLDAPEYQAVLSLDDIPLLRRVNVFIISDIDCLEPLFPQQSRVLACCHGVITASDTAFTSYLHHIGLVDGWLCSCPVTPRTRELVTHLWTGLASGEASRRKNRHLHIIPVGYPRLAALAEKLEEQSCLPDAIIYAPTLLDYFPEMGGERVKEHGARIIRVLLRNFPDYRVVFRPYRGDLDHAVVADIREQFRNEPRFVFDADPARLFSFAHGATVVTDFSHIGASFAYATLRAPVSFRPWQKSAPEMTRTEGFFTAASYTGLVRAVRTVLADGRRLAEELRARRTREIMPFATAFADIAALLKEFFADTPRQDWLTVERCNPAVAPADQELIRRMSGQSPANRARLAATAVTYGMPRSPLLGAFALHQAELHFPGRLYYSGLRAALSQAGLACEEEPAPDAARRLCTLAIADLEQAGDAQGRQLAEELLAALSR